MPVPVPGTGSVWHGRVLVWNGDARHLAGETRGEARRPGFPAPAERRVVLMQVQREQRRKLFLAFVSQTRGSSAPGAAEATAALSLAQPAVETADGRYAPAGNEAAGHSARSDLLKVTATMSRESRAPPTPERPWLRHSEDALRLLG